MTEAVSELTVINNHGKLLYGGSDNMNSRDTRLLSVSVAFSHFGTREQNDAFKEIGALIVTY